MSLFSSFVIPTEANSANISHGDILTRYLQRLNDHVKTLNDTSPLFLCGRPATLTRRSSFTCQPIGEGTIKETARKIATTLNLPDPHLYTSHSFRRTTATLAAEANVGADCMTVRNLNFFLKFSKNVVTLCLRILKVVVKFCLENAARRPRGGCILCANKALMAVSLTVTTRYSKSAVSLYLRILLIFLYFAGEITTLRQRGDCVLCILSAAGLLSYRHYTVQQKRIFSVSQDFVDFLNILLGKLRHCGDVGTVFYAF